MDRATRSACWMARIISGRMEPIQRTTGANIPQRPPTPRSALAVRRRTKSPWKRVMKAMAAVPAAPRR